MSKPEEKINSILKNNNINFIREKAFYDLRKGSFRYDFYIPNFNGAEICIEYDGEQHFKQVKHFQPTRRDFLKTQEHDRQKNSYCLANNIKLYRIPYWKIEEIFNIDDILKNEFLVTTKWWNDLLKVP